MICVDFLLMYTDSVFVFIDSCWFRSYLWGCVLFSVVLYSFCVDYCRFMQIALWFVVIYAFICRFILNLYPSYWFMLILLWFVKIYVDFCRITQILCRVMFCLMINIDFGMTYMELCWFYYDLWWFTLYWFCSNLWWFMLIFCRSVLFLWW